MSSIQAHFFNKNAIKYNQSINEHLLNICRPLFKHLGMNYFCYNRFLPGNRYLAIGTDLSYFEKPFQPELEKYIELLKTDILSSSLKRRIVWDNFGRTELTELIADFGHGHGFSIYKQHANSLEAWHFATDPGNAEASKFYVTHFDLFQRFIYYFNQTARDLIQVNDLSRLSAYVTGLTLDFPNPIENEESKFQAYLRETELRKHHFQINGQKLCLSKREVEYLFHMTQGKTAKEIAEDLNISYRTVESISISLKNKTGIVHRSEFVNLYNELSLDTLFGHYG